MKNSFKRIISTFLAVILIVGLVPLSGLNITASAEEYSGTCGENLTWMFDTETGELVISGTGTMTNYYAYNRPWETYEDMIKSVVIDNGVNSIGTYAFDDCGMLVCVAIPESVTTIGDNAFNDCYSLADVTIPSGVTNIDNHTFYGCKSLSSIVIPNSVVNIEEAAFYRTGLTKITIPNSVINIGDSAFESCTNLESVEFGTGVVNIHEDAFFNTNLKNVIIPKSIESVGERAFTCYSLDNITVDTDNDYLSSENGVLFNKHKTELMQYPAGKEKATYIMPDSVEKIWDYAFYFCENLTDISISDSVIEIGNYSFEHCIGLTDIIFPDSVTRIGRGAFYECYNLNEVFLGKNVTSIGSEIFYFCYNLKYINLPSSITDIGSYAFGYCESLTNIDLPEKIISLSEGLFWCCEQLTQIAIEKNVTNIGDWAFGGCVSFSDVYFNGTEAEWNDITIEEDNEYLINATIHYNCDKNHIPSYTATVITEPTCMNEGVIMYTCVCGAIYTEAVQKIGHSYEVSVTKAPTCTEEGIKTYTCGCGDIYTEIIPKEVHSYTSTVTIEPTYTTEGERTYTCEKCGDTYTEVIPVVPYPGNDDAVLSLSLIEETDTHVLLGVQIIEGCIAALDIGIYQQGDLIGQCSDMYLSEYVDRLMDMKLAAAACNKDTGLASYAKESGFGVGKYILFAEFEKTSDKKVTENDFVLGVSNCCDPSITKLNCSVVYDFSSNHKHEYTSEVTKKQTCTEDGIITYTCSCGDSYTEIIPKAHNYNHISVPSTCTVTGMEYDICSDCGEVINSKVLPLASHTLSHVVVASTCTVAGMEYDICSVCGGTFNTEVLPLAPHSWSEWKIVREATTALEGLKERRCTVCGTTEEEFIPKLNVIVDDESGISIEFNDEYDSGVEIKVEEVFDGDSFQIIDLYNGNNQSVIFDITTVKDGEKVQPNGKVKVRVPIPEGFDEEKLFVCYVDSTNGTVTNIPATIVDGYIEFFAEHFSYYAIVEKLGKVKSVSIGDISMSYKDSVTVTPNINVDEGVDYTVTYSSSNTDVVSVDANGKLTTNGKGSATITVTVTDEYGNTVTDTCNVNVSYKWWQWIIVIVLFGWIWY